MLSWAKRIAVLLLGLVGLTVLLGWLALSSSLLAGPRGDIMARYLSAELGQEVLINGGVQLRFDLAVKALLSGGFDPREILVDEAKVTLVEAPDGTRSWSRANSATSHAAKPEQVET